LTNADPIRLKLIARLPCSLPPTANRLLPRDTPARIEPTVTQPFDAIEEHLGAIYRYALRLARRPDLAEDLTQETILRGWRYRRKLREPRAARVWLLRIATNLWTDQLRRGKFQPVALEDEPACPRRSPQCMSEELENVRLALAAMDELPPRQRQVLYLVTCESMTNPEVAAILNIGEPAVKASLSLARAEMRRRLKELYEETCGRNMGNKV
jgi:RNA polymerase sigma-70 factor, ECF subfamily